MVKTSYISAHAGRTRCARGRFGGVGEVDVVRGGMCKYLRMLRVNFLGRRRVQSRQFPDAVFWGGGEL